MLDDAVSLDQDALRERVVTLEAQLVAAERRADEFRDEHDRLREAYRHLQLELELQSGAVVEILHLGCSVPKP